MRTLITAFVFVASLVWSACGAEWEVWKNCQWVPNNYNDGDSFHIVHNGQAYLLRLYFLDTPETDTSNRGADRQVADQSAHFGISQEAVMEVGKYAKQATAQMLSRPFTVLTRQSGAMGNSAIGRIYGFVTTADGKDLAEELVRNGLARSYGRGVSTPRRPEAQLRANFDRLERQARARGLGAYSKNPERLIARNSEGDLPKKEVQEAEPTEPADIFPDVPSISTAPTVTWSFTEPGVKPSQPEASNPIQPIKTVPTKIDLNTATIKELKSLPGIGPALAGAIIAERPFLSIEDVARVKGISKKKLEQLEGLVVVSGSGISSVKGSSESTSADVIASEKFTQVQKVQEFQEAQAGKENRGIPAISWP